MCYLRLCYKINNFSLCDDYEEKIEETKNDDILDFDELIKIEEPTIPSIVLNGNSLLNRDYYPNIPASRDQIEKQNRTRKKYSMKENPMKIINDEIICEVF